MKNNIIKKIIIAGAVIMLVVFIFVLSMLKISINKLESSDHLQLSDAERFSQEYPLLDSDNIFVYRSVAETADILANGTGVVFLGFKECPWCQFYALFLHDAALEAGLTRIFYCDIRQDRFENSANYQKIVSILSGFLQYDDEGRAMVYVPDLTVIDKGRILGRDFETSKETLGIDSPEEYWNDLRIIMFKDRLRESFMKVTYQISNSCNVCN